MLLVAGVFALVSGVIAVLVFFPIETSEPEVMVVPAPPPTVAPEILDTCFTPSGEGNLVNPTNDGLKDHLRGLVYRDLHNHKPVPFPFDLRTPMPQDAVLEDVEITGFYRSDQNRMVAEADYGVDSVMVKVQVNRRCQLTYWYTGPWPPY